MSSTVDVLKYLAAYAKGPAAYAEFTTSLIPTNDYTVLYETAREQADRPVSGTSPRQHAPNRSPR